MLDTPQQSLKKLQRIVLFSNNVRPYLFQIRSLLPLLTTFLTRMVEGHCIILVFVVFFGQTDELRCG
jgi:hypothetical protein